MVCIDFFTEEDSAKVVLENILNRIIPDNSSYNIYSFSGKHEMVAKLPNRLKAYSHQPLNTHKVVILIDRDNDNCRHTKGRLESIVQRAGLVSKRERPDDFQVVTRVVIEELESWFFGDVEALHEAFPSIPRTLDQKRGFAEPDAIPKPSNKLFKLLSAEYKGARRLPKIDVAQKVSPYMNCNMNKSESFNIFCDGVKACINQ